MKIGPPRSSRFCSPCRKADFASDSHSFHRPPSPFTSLFRPAVAMARTIASESLEGVGESLDTLKMSGSLHPIKTTLHFALTSPRPLFLSR